MVSDVAEIHATAIIAEGAILGEGTVVGPYTVIGPRVRIGARNRIGPHVVLEGNTTIGDENQIFQFASVGAVPQDLKYHGEESTLEIGNRNLIREYTTLQPGTEGGGMRTVIGNGNLFMACSHVGHDGRVGDNNVFANSVALSGHVTVGNRCIVGGLSGIHQFVHLGDLCLIGAGAMVSKDIPPYCMAQGDRARLVGLNTVGLKRAKFLEQDIRRMRELYRQIFFGEGTLRERLPALHAGCADFASGRSFLDFISASSRGVATPRQGASEENEAED